MDAKVADVQEKMAVASKVLAQCKKDRMYPQKAPSGAMSEFKKYTGRTVEPDCSNKAISFKELVEKRDNHTFTIITTDLTSTQFRRALVDSYLTKRQIPTLEDINNTIAEKDEEKDEVNLPASGFIMITLPSINKGIIIEDPKIVYRRTLYLKRMEQLRKEDAHLIYVKYNLKLNFNIFYKQKCNERLFVAVSTRLGLLQMFLHYSKDNMVKWLIDCTKPVDSQCVLVVEEDETTEIPIFMTKIEMNNWLTENRVRHDSKAHRGELSDLIAKKCVEHQSTKSKVDKLISSIKCEVIRYPKGVVELDFFDNFLELIKIHMHASGGRLNERIVADYITGARELDIETWRTREKELVVAEEKMLKEDMMMEVVVDRLKIMAADGQLPDDAEGLTDAVNWETIASEIIID